MLMPCLVTPGNLLVTPGDPAILMGGYRYHIGDQPGQSCGMGTVTRPRLGG